METWTKAVELEQLVIMLMRSDYLIFHFVRPNQSAGCVHHYTSPLRVLTVLRGSLVAATQIWTDQTEGF